MSVEKIKIINEALELSRGTPITSIDDTDDNSAKVARNFYDSVVNDSFARYPFSFALKKVKLNATTAPVDEWMNAFEIPPDSLRIWAVFNSSGNERNTTPTIEYDIGIHGDTHVIYSNNDNIVLEYVARITEELWSAPFKRFIVYALASEFALPLTQDKELQAILYAEAYGTPSQKGRGGRFAIARQHDSQQKPPTRSASSPLTDARISY